MEAQSAIREQLQARSAALARRVPALAAEMQRRPGVEDGEAALAAALAASVEAAIRELDLIERALRRMARGEYGRCAACEKAIPLARLALLPYAKICAACRRSVDLDYLDQLRNRHCALAALLRAIEDALGTQRRGSGEAPPDSPVLRLLDDLARELPEHFSLEEKGGYLSEVLAHAPRLTPTARRLRAQHPELCARSAAVLERARAAGADLQSWSEVRARFGELAADLRAHEAGEDALIREALQSDLGGGD